jgi:hypothetical protein
MRVGGSDALGSGVAVGRLVGGGEVGGAFVGVGAGGVAVIVHSGRSSGVGSAPAGGSVGRGVSVDGVVGDAVAVNGTGLGAVVGWGGDVMASTIAPSSVITGGAGASIRVQIPHPNPARIINTPNINIPLDRIGAALFMVVNPTSTKKPCQVNLPCGIMPWQSAHSENFALEVNPCLL